MRLPLAGLILGGRAGAWALEMILFVSVPLTVLMGVPLYFAFRRKRSVVVCAVAGLFTGVVGALCFLAVTNPLAALRWSPLFVGAGLVSGLVFWRIAVRGNPNAAT